MKQRRKGAVFLDRDGVINAAPQVKRYITCWQEFRFLPGSITALRRLKGAGKTVVILSNQAGVGKRVMTAAQLAEITRRMLRKIRAGGGSVQAVYYCTHRPAERCPCRKPKAGMLRRAARRFQLDLARSVVVGDNEKDIRMGRLGGCRTMLVLSGATDRREARRMRTRPDRIVKNLGEAISWILNTDR